MLGLTHLLTLALSLCSVHGLSSTHTCGVDHPAFASEASLPPLVVPQAYHPEDSHPALRQLQQTQTYGASAVPTVCGGTAYSTTFVPVTPASAAPLRIKVLWDVIVNGDTGYCEDGSAGCTYQCSSGSTPNVMVKNTAGSAYSAAGFSCSDSDATGTLAPPASSAANMQIMAERTAAAVSFWASTLQTVPVLDSIVIPTSLAAGLPGSVLAVTRHVCPPSSTTSCASLTVTGADLVVIMTARPSPNSPIAGYALCLQSDQWGRCTVGQLNWVPGALDREGFLSGSESSKDTEMHTALHELVHLFGGMGPGASQPSSNFVNASTGCRAATAGVLTTLPNDPAYPTGVGKPVSYISSPRVAALTRDHYSCPTALGFPLEDVPLGKGAHWEARVAGPELMSYGSNSGQSYLSDLTLAYLEDTGHYIANYSKAGFITQSTFNSLAASDASARAPRWGYKAGCAWLGQPAPGTPTVPLPQAMPAPYTCATANAHLCSSDNRQSSVCIIQSTHTSVPDAVSYGEYRQLQAGQGGSGGPQQSPTTPNGGKLPSWAQWFPSDAAAGAATGTPALSTAANTGGFSAAMDYLPVPVGYWSCAFQIPGSNTSGGGEDGFRLSSIFSAVGSATDMAKFGGQLRCPTCRCMPSSLMEMSSGNLVTTFPSYGLCYRANCVMATYLQIAIKGQFDGQTYWYACPPGGGKLYIPGYFGALTCPPAAPFCALEAVSGLRYPEQSLYSEWVFWVVVVGGSLLAFLSCALQGPRDCCIGFWKRACGVRVFDAPAPAGAAAKAEGTPPPPPPHSPACARALGLLSALTLAAGLGIAAAAAWVIRGTLVLSGTVQLLGLGVLLAQASLMGLCGARARPDVPPSCWLISYFALGLLLLLLAVYVAVDLLQLQPWAVTLATYYPAIVAAGLFVPPANATRAESLTAAAGAVQGTLVPVLGAALAVCGALAGGLLAAASMVRPQVLAAMVLTVCHHLLLAAGLLLLGVAIYLYAVNGGVIAPLYEVMGYLLAMALLFVAVGLVGHATVRYKGSTTLYVLYFLFSCSLCAVCAGLTWLATANTSRIAAWVQEAPDSVLGPVATALGIASDRGSLLTSLSTNAARVGLATGVLLLLQLLAIVCAVRFARYAAQWRVEHKVGGAGGAGSGRAPRRAATVAPSV